VNRLSSAWWTRVSRACQNSEPSTNSHRPIAGKSLWRAFVVAVVAICLSMFAAPKANALDNFGYPMVSMPSGYWGFYTQADAYGACVAFAKYETSKLNRPGYYECRAVNPTMYAAWESIPAFDGFSALNGWDYPNCCGADQEFSWLTVPTNGFVPPKDLGHPNCSCADPIDVATGNRFEEATDATIDNGVAFKRYYNSLSAQTRGWHLGPHWTYGYSRYLDVAMAALPRYITSGGTNPPSQSLLLVNVVRDDGRQFVFTSNYNNGGPQTWASDTDVHDQLTELYDSSGNVSGWKYFDAAARVTEMYSTQGNLLSVTDATGKVTTFTYTSVPSLTTGTTDSVLASITSPAGRVLNFTYTSSGALASLGLPDGSTVAYQQDANLNLTTVTFPDGKTFQYIYNEAAYAGGNNPNLMTGIVDEAGVRFATFSYQSINQPYQTSNAGGVNTFVSTFFSSSPTTSTFTTPLNATRTFNWTFIKSQPFVSSIASSCSGCTTATTSYVYDANGTQTQMTDPLGNVTSYTPTTDGSGLEIQRVEAVGTSAQRTIKTSWNETFWQPLQRTVLNASGNAVNSTQWVYNSAGQTLARCDIDPTNPTALGYSCSNTGSVPAGVRRSTYAYCTTVGTGCPIVGLMRTAISPRTDLTQATTYSYYGTPSAVSYGAPGAACYMPGDLYQVTDSLGHITTVASYDADGRPTRITDANGVNTDMTYTPRGWLASRNVDGVTTSFTYTPYGAVQTVTDADNVTTTYGYDAAHRLVKITDAQGNYIQYTLNAAGNKTAEQVYDASGTLHKNLTRSFNTLGQLTKVMDGLNHIIFDASASSSYDANGNLVQSADGLGIQRQQSYDAPNRLVQTIDNYNGTN
jgi:YD repeat-containing protein